MLLARNVENSKIDDYLGQVRLSKVYFCPAGLGKGLGYGTAALEPPTGARNRQKDPHKQISIILVSELNQRVHLIQQMRRNKKFAHVWKNVHLPQKKLSHTDICAINLS